GQPVILHHFYIAYAEELSIKKTESEKAIVFCKWLHRGLDETLLKQIGIESYNLDQSIVCPDMPTP
ncbi:unnamed protein product, partial [marine sediment metagenome]